jgi:hypothetical protein
MNIKKVTRMLVLASCCIAQITLAEETNQTAQASSKGPLFEGIKYNYKLNFPTGWTLYTPQDIKKLPKQMRDGFTRMKMSALALASDNMSNITLAANEKRMDKSELAVPSDPRVQKVNTTDQIIGEHQWYIQEVLMGQTNNGKFSPMARSYHAATQHKNGTIRITFTFPLWTENHKQIVDSVLASYREE